MDRRRLPLWIGLMVGAIWASAVPAGAQGFLSRSKDDQWQRLHAAGLVPLDQLPPQLRDSVRQVLERPTLHASGPAETFPCRPELYRWFLDHPDRAMQAWRRLGVPCIAINDRGDGRFGWSDGQGSEVNWETIYRDDHVRVWYAQGQVKPGLLLPTVPARAVVVLRHTVTNDSQQNSVVEHQADVFAYTDSKTAALVARLMGPSAPRMAEQSVGQMQMFFSALAWYLQRYPERTDVLLGTRSAAASSHPAPPADQASAR